MATIAGHTFSVWGTCDCGARWIDLLNRQDEWKENALGIAHSGGLIEREIRELEEARDRPWQATAAIAASRGK